MGLDQNKKVCFDYLEKAYGDAYQQYPSPCGMAWAPIMDAYRAAPYSPKQIQPPCNDDINELDALTAAIAIDHSLSRLSIWDENQE